MLNAKQATVKYSEGGMGKTTMPLGKMFALAFMAGMFISFAGVASSVAATTAVAKCNLSFSDAFIKGIFCNILVCVAVMMALTAERVSGKIMALFLPIMVFVISGFEHSVANMSYISGGLLIHSQYGSLGLDTAGLTWYNFIVSNLVPVTLGNIVGGLFIGFMFWFTARDKK